MRNLEEIAADLQKLPPVKLEEAASFIHALQPISPSQKQQALEKCFGSLTTEEADQLESSIAQHCEKVDASHW